MLDNSQCPICSSKNFKLIRDRFTTKYGTVPIEIESVEMYRCGNCGEDVLTPEQSEKVSDAVKAAAREHLQLLPPERIVEIRRKLNLTQEGLESLLGIGPKVVTRWENGRVLQTKTADDLLRLMEKLPEAVSVLKDIRGARRASA